MMIMSLVRTIGPPPLGHEARIGREPAANPGTRRLPVMHLALGHAGSIPATFLITLKRVELFPGALRLRDARAVTSGQPLPQCRGCREKFLAGGVREGSIVFRSGIPNEGVDGAQGLR
jgi:hypothetical protein